MKIIKMIVALTLLALSLSAQAQDRQTVVIEGAEVLDSEVFLYFPGATTYKVYIEFDTTLTPIFSSPTEKHYDNAVTGFYIEFFDVNGALIPGPSVEYDADDPTVSALMQPRVRFFSGSMDVLSFRLDTMEREFGHWVDLVGPAGSLYADFTGFPQFVTGPTSAQVQYIHMAVGSSWNPHFDVYGAITSIAYLDSDGDGISDAVDSCIVSELGETVVLNGWYDSGVPNYVDENGCSVMDHYAVCEVEEAEQSTSSWGWFQPVYSGPSYCEKQVAYGLVGDGVLSYGEARTLRDALYQSYQSGGIR